jgi:hypothetical protein
MTVDPTLGRIPRVLVPIELDGLALPAGQSGFADCRMTNPDPAGGLQDLLPLPFADLPAPRPRGVYLHWALPDALTHGQPTQPPAADGTAPVADLPPIPDRWLVVRFFLGSTPDHRRARAWVLESGGPQPVVADLASWHESGTRAAPGHELTALGAGDLAWAAYYDNVVDRLGFYDPLDDGATGPLGYLVCGWFADSGLDPVADPAITSVASFYAKLAELGWSLPPGELEEDILATPDGVFATLHAAAPLTAASPAAGRSPVLTDGSWWPQGMLLHGSVVGIGWPDAGFPGAEDGLLSTDQGGPPDPVQTRVAFGATTTDALGALMVGFLAAAEGVPQDIALSEDRMLEAFQIGALNEIDQPDGRVRLDTRLHADGFQAFAAGQQPSELAGGAGDASETGDNGSVQRSQPRFFGPGEPAVVIQGLRRSLKHGGDGRFSQDGTLVCRLSGFTVTSLSARLGDGTQRAAVSGGQILELPFTGVPDLPIDCASLVLETALLDPGSARTAALLTLPVLDDTSTVDDLTQNFMVEQTVWWALRDPLVNAAALLANSGIAGTLPSPLAVTPPAAAWAPRHLDWAVEVFRSPDGMSDWTLSDLDYEPDDPAGVDTRAGQGVVVSGRALLTGGVAERAALAGEAAIELASAGGAAGLGQDTSDIFVPADDGATDVDQGLNSGTETIAQAFIAALRGIDVMGTTLTGIHARLRNEPTGQWVGSSPRPAPPLAPDAPGLISGFLRPVRMRLVDTFGQVVDLLGSSTANPADATAALSSRLVTTGVPGLVGLAPRYAAQGRVLLRFVDAITQPSPAGSPPPPDLAQIDETARPVCGYLLPDHLDGALEVFDATGAALGQLLPAPDDTGRAVWERAPGQATGAGEPPSAVITDPTLAAIADGLVNWGQHDTQNTGEGALAALLRLIDSTLWSTDPFGHAGDEHVSLLTGHPIVVLRAMLRLDVNDPLGPRDIVTTPVPVRLGALAQWQDGLLGFYVGDDLAQVHPSGTGAAALARPVGPGQGYLSSAAQLAAYHQSFAADLQPGQDPATPVTHPYVATDATVQLWPGQAVPVTLLVVPHAVVHATSGLLPRKELGVRRQWVADALAQIAPNFRFGPVLVDPRTIRMPISTELAGTWSWSHRTDVSQWADQPVVNAASTALITADPVEAEEGWLILHPKPETSS